MADWTARATHEGADVVLFPELAITGYPPEDLVLRPEFVEDNNGSPFDVGKAHERTHVLRNRARETGAWIVYVNAVGGQDELVFDGGSIVMAPDGTITSSAARFDEDLVVITLEDVASLA